MITKTEKIQQNIRRKVMQKKDVRRILIELANEITSDSHETELDGELKEFERQLEENGGKA